MGNTRQLKNRFTRWPFITIIFLIVIFFWRVFIGPKVFSGADLLLKAYYPWFASESAITDSPPQNPEISDPVFSFVPNIMFCLESIKKGILPLWTPLKMCGMPQLADGTTPIFFPLNFIYLLGLHPLAAGTIKIIIELIIFGIFCYLYGKEIGLNDIGAISATIIVLFCTRTIAWLEFYMFLDARMWYPAILWAYERYLKKRAHPYLLLGSLFFGFCVLSLSPKDISYFIQFFLIYIIFTSIIRKREDAIFSALIRPFLFFVTIVIFGIGLGAIQIIPLLEFSHYCGRTPASLRLISLPEFISSVKDSIFSDNLWYMHFDAHWRLISLVSFILPKFFGATHDKMIFTVNPYAEHINYIGILPLVLVIAATISLRKNRLVLFFTVTATISYLLWANMPVLTELYNFITFGAMAGKGALRLKFIMSFCFAYVAGIAITQLCSDSLEKKKLLKLATIICYIFITFGLLLILYEGLGHNKFYGLIKITNFFGVDDKLRAGISEAITNLPPKKIFIAYHLFNACVFLVMSILSLIFFKICERIKIPKALCGRFAIMVIFLDLFIFGNNYNPVIPLQQAYPPTKTTNFLQADKSLYRIYRFGSNDPLTAGAINAYGISDAGGRAMSLYSKRSVELLELIVPTNEFKSYLSPSYFCSGDGFLSRLLDILNIKYIASLDPIPAFEPGSNYKIVFDFLEQFKEGTIKSGGVNFVAIDRFAIDGIAKRVILENPPSRIQYSVYVPASCSLAFSIGMNPQSWKNSSRSYLIELLRRLIKRHPPLKSDGMIFKVMIDDSIKSKVVFEKMLDPAHNENDRKWHADKIPLYEYGGKTIKITFITDPGPKNDGRCDWGGWADLLLVSEPPNKANRSLGEQKFKLVWRDEGIHLYENKGVLPRSFIAFNSKVIKDDAKLKEKIRNLRSDGEDCVYFSHGKELKQNKPFSTKTNIIEYTPIKVRIKASLDSEGYLVLADSFYPGWRVFVDGKEHEIIRAFYNLRAVLLEPGEHDVTFQYAPSSFIKGRNITIIFIVFFLAWALGYSVLKMKRLK